MARPAPASKTFHALVLAAGQGSRMGHLTSSLPKSCLPLTADGSATFIRRIVDLSVRCGAESIIVAGVHSRGCGLMVPLTASAWALS
jgi:choline kinase